MTRDDAEILANEWAAAWNDRTFERVLEYFHDDVAFTSPTAAAVVGRYTVYGKDALREYWATAMSRIGSLQFTLDHVVWDASTNELAIIYTAHIDGRSRRVSENLTFGPEGLVISAEVFHGVSEGRRARCREDADVVISRRRVPEAADPALVERLIQAWRTHDRVTRYLIEHLPEEIWDREVPGVPRLTVRQIAAHIHNSRCRWIKSLCRGHGIAAPPLLNLRRVRRAQLVRALPRSSAALLELMRLGASSGGVVPPASWQNFPTDLAHFLSYFVAHEAHHRGQLMLVARQLGHRLPNDVREGVWQWKRRSRED